MDNNMDGMIVSLFLFAVFVTGTVIGGCVGDGAATQRMHLAAVSRGLAEYVVDDSGRVQFKWKEPAKDE